MDWGHEDSRIVRFLIETVSEMHKNNNNLFTEVFVECVVSLLSIVELCCSNV